MISGRNCAYWFAPSLKVIAMSEKILISNNTALAAKYGKAGLAAVMGAVKALIQADRKRGLATRLVDISSPRDMKKAGGSAVTSSTNERQCKDAVDAIYAHSTPDYLVLLDGPDVLPHLKLDNPLPDDKDASVPSDLPYASDRKFTSRDTAAYAAVTRVVGRIPGISGASAPDHLVARLKSAAAHKSLKKQDYLSAFALSAEVWQESTQTSADHIWAGNMTVRICPPTGSPGIAKMLSPMMHFINCHGAEVDPKFYGQKGAKYPVAMTSRDVTAMNHKNKIIAAECCFGAQLFDPALASNASPIPNAYLDAGAIAFFGSTNVAYGPPLGNGAADLVTQFFLINVLNGASLGRACLQARQKFVLGQKMEDPTNIKTLAQFILLGDPSLHPCMPETNGIDVGKARQARRIALAAAGKAAMDCSGFPGSKIRVIPKQLAANFTKLAAKRGFDTKSARAVAFSVEGGADYGKGLKALDVEQQVLVITNHRDGTAAKLPQTRVLVAHAQDDRIIQIIEYARK